LRKIFPLKVLTEVLLSHPQAFRMLGLTTMSFAFSIAVILGTIGLMDGFESTLKIALKKSSGDLIVTSERGFFEPDLDLWPIIKKHPQVLATMIHESEAFVIKDENTKGVMVRGIDSKSFFDVTGLKMEIKPGELVIGEALQKEWQIQKNQLITIAFAKGHPANPDLPLMESFVVSDFIKHGVHEKDLRFVYLNFLDMEKIFQHQKANIALLKVLPPNDLIEFQKKLKSLYGQAYKIKPYWQEFSSLFEAVQVEKFSITIILQLIVIVAIFNITAMIIYFSEKRAQEFFLVQALGLRNIDLLRFWFLLLFIIWSISCFLATMMAGLFNYLLLHLSWLKIPGDIYVIDHLYLKLGVQEYITVFLFSLLWIVGVGFYTHKRIKSQSIIHGLRMEQS
jgi:ABC-type lipoprotein release transport system permease subunit